MNEKLNMAELKERVLREIIVIVGACIDNDVISHANWDKDNVRALSIELDSKNFDIPLAKMTLVKPSNMGYRVNWTRQLSEEVAKALLVSIAHEICESPFEQNKNVKIELL